MRKNILPRFLKNLSIRTKFLVAAGLLLAAILVSGYLVSSHFYRVTWTERIEAARWDFENCCASLSGFEGRMVRLSFIFQSDEDSVELLSDMKSLPADQYQTAADKLVSKMTVLLDGSNEYSCRLYVDSSLDVFDNTARLLPLDELEKTDWGAQAMSGWGHWQFLSPGTIGSRRAALVTPIRNNANYRELIGLLRIDIDDAAFQTRMHAPRSEGYVACFLQTPDGVTVSASDPKLPGFIPDVPENTLFGFESYRTNTAEAGTDTIFYRSLPDSQWRLVMVVKGQELRDLLITQLTLFIVLGSFLTLSGFLCVMPILFSAVKRIRRFHRYVQTRSADGPEALSAKLEPISQDEIGQLIAAHTELMDNIERLNREREEKEKEVLRLELSVLQAQINPHFLYNTLEAILWMAKLNQPDKVESTIRSLTRFYRLCLSKGKSVLPVSQELEIVKNYFEVQSARYEQDFQLIVDVPEEIRELELPKITLQPLVENALLHGILESDSQCGWVRISGAVTEAGAELYVEDSGGHFAPEDWERILAASGDGQQGDAGYGLSNVERRLRLFFEADRVMRLDRSDPAVTRIVLPFPR